MAGVATDGGGVAVAVVPWHFWVPAHVFPDRFQHLRRVTASSQGIHGYRLLSGNDDLPTSHQQAHTTVATAQRKLRETRSKLAPTRGMRNDQLRTRVAQPALRLRARLDAFGGVDVDVVAFEPGAAATRSRGAGRPAKRVRRPRGKTQRKRAARRRAGPAASRRSPCIILFVAANPDGTLQLRLAEECAEIRREIRLTLHRDDLRFEARDAVGIIDLVRNLDELAPTVLHISGHGDRDGLLLQDEHGQPQRVSPRALAMIIEAATRAPRAVVLNVCHSAAYAEALRTSTDCVVCIDGAIQDSAARMLATRLYGAIGNGCSVGNAVKTGVATLAAHDLPDELMPRCVTRDGVDAFQLVLAGPR